MDTLDKLPINESAEPRPGDLEFIYNIFQPKNTTEIIKYAGTFKTAFLGAILFGIFSLPFLTGLSDKYWKNSIYSRIFLMLLFFIVFYIIQKVYLRS
jgi:hypothetical protein